VTGLPGAGKSTLLAAAGAELEFTVISRDVIRAAMFPGPACHTAEETRLAFEAMVAAAASRLRRGARVALDGCCFAHRWQRRNARELADATGATLVAVHLELRVEEAARRIAAGQPHPANDRDAALVARVAGHLAAPEPEDLVIDASRPASEVWAVLRDRLEATAAIRRAGRSEPPGPRSTASPETTAGPPPAGTIDT
jgi:predicted kinase